MTRIEKKPMQRTLLTVREIVQWWWSELRTIAAQLLRQLPRRKSPQLFVRVVGASLSIERPENGERKVLRMVTRAAGGSWTIDLPDLPAEYAGSRTAIVLPESDLFLCDFNLPAAAERQLDSVLRLQLERALPIPLDQVLFDSQVVTRDRSCMTARVAVAHRQLIDELRELVSRIGLKPVSAGLVSATGTPTFNVLRRRRAPLRWRPSIQDTWLLRATAAGMAMLALVIGALWIRERAVVSAGSSELHAQAVQLAADRARLSEEARPLLALQTIAGTADAPAILSALSTSMPAGAWFSHVDITAHVSEPGSLRLTGAVTSRDEALAAIRTLPGVQNLEATSAFSGVLNSAEMVEITAEIVADKPKVAAL